MDGQMDSLKLYKHGQRVRIIQEQDEEMWISSEDLRTDGESDEEKQATKETLSKPTCPDKPCATPYKVDDSELSKLRRESQRETRKNPESNVEALNLENNWRPKRGSLKLPHLVNDDCSNMFSNGLSMFYNEMLLNLHTLKRTPLLEENGDEDDVFDEEFDLSEEKEDGRIEAVKDNIRKMDEEISSVIHLYKTERDERIKVQDEMCSVISENPRAQYFLDLCQFQRQNQAEEEADDEESQPISMETIIKKKKIDDRFIKRNIKMAKHGSMANLCLTDEEKQQLENILQEEDVDQSEEAQKMKVSIAFEDDDSDVSESLMNAYRLSNLELSRLEEINSKLKELCQDHLEFEKNMDLSAYKKMSTFSLQKALHDVDEKLLAINKELEEKPTEMPALY